MTGKEKRRRLFNRSRREFAVSFIGYLIGFTVILFVLNRVSLIQRQPQLALVLAVAVPLVPFLILLAYSGRIETVEAFGFLKVNLTESDRSEHEEIQPSSDRRTVLKLGALVAAIGTMGHFVMQWAGFNGLFPTGGDGTDSDGGDSQTEAQPDTPTDTMSETDTPPSQVEYGDQTYGQRDYGG